MIHSITFKANRDQILKLKQDLVNKSNKGGNKSQIPYEYKVGDQLLLETPRVLLSTPCTGLYPVTKVYKNETIQIQRGIVSERLNIRQICSFQATSG